MKGINVYSGETDLKQGDTTQFTTVGGHTVWINARPYGKYFSIIDRIRYAYYTFIGKVDVVSWEKSGQ